MDFKRFLAFDFLFFVLNLMSASSIIVAEQKLFGADIIVNTTFGKVEGVKGSDFAYFLGIPYAAPPTGRLRFQPPEDPHKWNYTLRAKVYCPMCMQEIGAYSKFFGMDKYNMSEDCLYLNVFTSSVSPKNLMPVMLFIHGGAYTSGSASQFPVDGILQNLVSHDVVVVTINYRLNVFGFFTTNTSALPANNGLMDQIKALQWVQAEINHFGGDPKNVTIFGQSAGSGSVSILTYSPKAEGLFDKAIMESATIFTGITYYGLTGVYANSSRDFAVSTGCISFNQWNLNKNSLSSECLKNKSAAEILAHAMNASQNWAPTFDGDGGVFPNWPKNLVGSRVSTMPIMMGTTKDETALSYIFGLFLGKLNGTDFSRKLFEKQLAKFRYGAKRKLVQDLVRFVYLDAVRDGKLIDPSNSLEWFKIIVQMSCSPKFASIMRSANMLLLSNNTNCYLYSFDYISDAFPWPKSGNTTYKGVFHIMELLYLFNTMWQETTKLPWKFSKNDTFISKSLGKLWTEFSKTGRPSEAWHPLAQNSKLGSAAYYSINLHSKMQSEYEEVAVNLWNQLIPELTQSINSSGHQPGGVSSYGKGYYVATWLLLSIVVLIVAAMLIMIMKQHKDTSF